jgi:predicted DNA-binding transcriptional regulator YafY
VGEDLLAIAGQGETGGDDPEWAVVRLRFGGVAAVRILLSFGGDAEVVSPPEVRDDLAAVAAATVDLYDRTLHHRTRV